MDLKVRLLPLIVLALVAAVRFPVAHTQPVLPQTSPRQPVGKSYKTLRPEQKRLVDDFIERYNSATGSDLIPEGAYDRARLSVRTTFDAVTHALMNAKITDATGKEQGHAIDLVEAIDEVMGEEPGVGGDRQFRVYVYLKPNAFDILSSSKEFFRDKDNVTYHKGFPICFRLKHGPPSIQFSISRDKKLSDIDVDYRSFKFPQALVNGHLTAANSDIRAGNNLSRHDSRWVGLSGWWRDIFEQLGNIAKPPKESGSQRLSPIPLNPGVKAAQGVDKSAHDFLRTWVIDKQANKSVAYFSRRGYACLEGMSERSQKYTSPGMVLLRTEIAMKNYAERVGNASSVSDVFEADQSWSPSLKEGKNAFATEFRLVSVPADMAKDEECVSNDATQARSKEKFYATAFREKRGDERVISLVWTKEKGYWKIIAIRWEDNSDAGIIPKNAVIPVEPVEKEPQKIAGDSAAVQDIKAFYKAWILERDVKQALQFISQRSYQCLPTSSADLEKLTPLARIESGLEQLLRDVPPRSNLSEMMSSVQPVNDLVHPVEQENSNAFAIMALPDQKGDGFLCESRHLQEDPSELQLVDAKYGTYYLSASKLNLGDEESPAFLLLWVKENDRWKIVSWTIDSP
jgi:hypothetical protein